MNNAAVVPFYFQENEIRTISDVQGNPMFVAKDVALALGFSDTVNAIKQHCRGVVKHHPIIDSLGRTQHVRVIYEPDLFRLVANSNLPSAERFERWIFEEVLPSIGRSGSYSMREPQGMDLSMEALVARIVTLVVPEVTKQILPLAGKFENQLERTRADFSYYSSVSGFYHYFCQDGGQNVVVLKDKLYDVYRQYCEIGGGTPFTKSYFCGQLYRAVTGCSATTVTVDGRRIPAVRGLSLLPGWPTIMIDIKRRNDERAAQELADRRKYYFGIEAEASEA
jgi:prophage antirepressor-like protein